jgi:hypothetical protein
MEVKALTIKVDSNDPNHALNFGQIFDGRAVINEFSELKWVTIEPADQPYPF